MDLSLPLIGVLGLVGYNLNKTPNSREYTDKRVKIPASELRNGKTIYESKEFVRITNDEQTKMDKFYKDEKTVKGINNYTTKFNNTSIFFNPQERDTIPKNSKDQIKLLGPSEKVYAGPMFKETGYSAEPLIADVKESFSQDISPLSGMKTDFKHTNMQPFFGSKVKQPVDSVSILDKYTGRKFITKKEQFMNVPENKQDINGMKLYTDLIDKSRFTPGLTRNNVLPFKQTKDAPIPGEYNRGQQKNVDELRALNKPKASGMEARINVGSGNYVGPMDQEFVKNKNITTYRGDFNGMLPQFSKDQEAQYIGRDALDLRDTNKKQAMESSYEYAPAKYTNGNKMQVSTDETDKGASFYGGSHKFESANDWIRNVQNSIKMRDENSQQTYTAYTQERETTDVEKFGNAFDKRGNVMAHTEKAKTTNKELTSYSYTPSAQSVIEKAPMGIEFYNKFEMKEKPTREYFAGGAKKFAPQSNKAIIAQRPKTTFQDYTGGARMNNMQSADVKNIGQNTSNRKTMETDFTYRIG